MLILENVKQSIFKFDVLLVVATGNGYGFALAGGGAILYEVFDFVVVNVICAMKISKWKSAVEVEEE